MTIHAAKGLEWPVVVVPDLARRYPSQSYPVLFDPELGVAVNFGEDDREPVLHRLHRSPSKLLVGVLNVSTKALLR
jgi:ATP-dependent exoDNAse (exonuclease V) beta subunit